jgi:hypothetical protein
VVSLLAKFVEQRLARAQFDIAPEDMADRLGICLLNEELALFDPIAERYRPAHPGGGVERLGDRDEAGPGFVEHVHDLAKSARLRVRRSIL